MGTTVFERRRPAASVVAHALAGTRQASFWLEDVERPRYPRLDGELTADLAIVGGGYTGLWSAVLAKQRNPGASVVLLEAQAHRLGGIRSQRRLLRGQPHPRPGER